MRQKSDQPGRSSSNSTRTYFAARWQTSPCHLAAKQGLTLLRDGTDWSAESDVRSSHSTTRRWSSNFSLLCAGHAAEMWEHRFDVSFRDPCRGLSQGPCTMACESTTIVDRGGNGAR